MTENNGYTVIAVTDPKPSYEELETKLANQQGLVTYWVNRYEEIKAQVDKVRKSIEEVLAGDVDAMQTYEDFKYPFELLGVTLDREVEVEVTVTYRGTITLPLNVEVDDLNISDFQVDDLAHNDYPTWLTHYDTNVEER